MRYLLALLVLGFTAQAYALDFDSFSKDNTLFRDLPRSFGPETGTLTPSDVGGEPTGREARRQNNTTVLKEMPLLDLLAERVATSGVIELGGTSFLASVVLDDNWDVYFQLKQKGSCANPGVWKEESLKDGVVFKYTGGELNIKKENDVIVLTDAKGNSSTTSSAKLFDLLYTGSSEVTFADLVTYAVIRNFAPLSGNEGIITLRKGSDGLYYYSLTPDKQVAGSPRWLLAINGVLYGLRITDTDAVFLAKPIEAAQKPSFLERQLKF